MKMRRRKSGGVITAAASVIIIATVLISTAAVSAVNLQANRTCSIVTFIPFTDRRPGPSGDHAQFHESAASGLEEHNHSASIGEAALLVHHRDDDEHDDVDEEKSSPPSHHGTGHDAVAAVVVTSSHHDTNRSKTNNNSYIIEHQQQGNNGSTEHNDDDHGDQHDHDHQHARRRRMQTTAGGNDEHHDHNHATSRLRNDEEGGHEGHNDEGHDSHEGHTEHEGHDGHEGHEAEHGGGHEGHEGHNHMHYGYGQWPDEKTLAAAGFSMMAAAELAKRHFNERNNTLVTDLNEVLWFCDIQLGSVENGYFDSAYSRRRSAERLFRMQQADLLRTGDPRASSICAVVGPVDSRASEGVTTLTEILDIPHVGYANFARQLSNRVDFPSFARLIPDAESYARIIARYVQRDVWKRDYVAILYDQSEYGEEFDNTLLNSRDEFDDWKVITEHFHYSDGYARSVQDALDSVVARGYHTVILISDRIAALEMIAIFADERGLLDDHMVWALTGDALRPDLLRTVNYKVGSSMDKLLRGAALFTNYDRFVYHGESDPFLRMWRQQNASLVAELNRLQPRDERTGDFLYQAEPDYFQTEAPTQYASYMYDAIMAVGIGACQADSLAGNASHIDRILHADFQGASGPVKFKYNVLEKGIGNSRDPDSVVFGVYNIRPRDIAGGERHDYNAVLTAIYRSDHGYLDRRTGRRCYGAWKRVESTRFIFADGTPDEPMPLRSVMNEHHLPHEEQTAGFCLVGISLFVAGASAVWVFCYRNSPRVKVSQPGFLYLLCFGASLVGSSTVFISFDEGKGWTREQLDRACSAWPWFFVVGYLIMYCAIFCKLWRLRRVLSMRRKIIHIRHALLPFWIIIACSVVVLVAWQVLDPLSWNVTVINDDPLETYGECQSTVYGLLPFVMPLVILFTIIMASSAFMSWQLKDIQEDLSESRWIFFGVATHIQTWAIGIPVAILTNEVSKEAFYIMLASLAFVFSTSLVALVIWPKVYSGSIQSHIQNHHSGRRVSFTIGGSGLTHVSGLMAEASNHHHHHCPSQESFGISNNEDHSKPNSNQEQSLATTTTGQGSAATHRDFHKWLAQSLNSSQTSDPRDLDQTGGGGGQAVGKTGQVSAVERAPPAEEDVPSSCSDRNEDPAAPVDWRKATTMTGEREQRTHHYSTLVSEVQEVTEEGVVAERHGDAVSQNNSGIEEERKGLVVAKRGDTFSAAAVGNDINDEGGAGAIKQEGGSSVSALAENNLVAVSSTEANSSTQDGGAADPTTESAELPRQERIARALIKSLQKAQSSERSLGCT